MRDLIASLASLLAVFLCWRLNLFLLKRGHMQGEMGRNLLHLLAGLWGFLWLLVESYWLALAFALAAFLGVTLAYLTRKHWRWMLLNTAGFGWAGTKGIGLLLYALALLGITAFLWDARAVGTAAILTLALGDSLADATGCRWGHLPWGLPWTGGKTLEGSLACVLGSTLGVLLAYWVTGQVMSVWMALACGTACALAEMLSPSKMDNLLLPAVCAGFLLML
jgi:dolichol kinase